MERPSSIGAQMNGLHFDPLNAVLIVIAIVGAWRLSVKRESKLESDSRWHSEWIRKHSDECDQRERINTGILTELQKSNAHLTTLSEAQGERLSRIEDRVYKH